MDNWSRGYPHPDYYYKNMFEAAPIDNALMISGWHKGDVNELKQQ